MPKVWHMFLCALLALPLAGSFFICLVSIYVGLTEVERPGFWVPIVLGSTASLWILLLGYTIMRWILRGPKSSVEPGFNLSH